MKLLKQILILISVVSLFSCASTETLDKSKDIEIQKEVIKVLQKEYKQPFKILDFKYKYESHTSPTSDCVFLYCKSRKYGTYYFKVQAIDNSIIIMNFKLEYADKESIKSLIDSFKKNQLKDVYCVGLIKYYGKNLESNTKVKEPITSKNREYCDKNYFNLADNSFVVRLYDKKYK